MTFKDREDTERVPRITPQTPMSAPVDAVPLDQQGEADGQGGGHEERSYLTRLRGMLKEPNPVKRVLNVTVFVFCLALGLMIIIRSVSPAVLDGGVQQAAQLIDKAGKTSVTP
ncbi:hypothetical protein [Nevskia ramosa]|uniref:hypothetical protein n=1 Tax=Nevskia ramosa TaxID=64002 RepID=UPI0023547841|nr:hypothetical protein [Nevskia ramosa]